MDLTRKSTYTYYYSLPVKRTIDVNMPDHFFMNEDGSKHMFIDVNVHHCIEHDEHDRFLTLNLDYMFKHVVKCSLSKDSQSVNLDLCDSICDSWVLDKVAEMYTNQEMVEYINSITEYGS